MAFEIKRNDLRPRWRVQLTANDVPVNLTGITAARFTMKSGANPIKVNRRAMTVIDAATGVVEMVWTAADTNAVGTYDAEVEVEWDAGEYQTFPSSGYFTIEIYEDLDTAQDV